MIPLAKTLLITLWSQSVSLNTIQKSNKAVYDSGWDVFTTLWNSSSQSFKNWTLQTNGWQRDGCIHPLYTVYLYIDLSAPQTTTTQWSWSFSLGKLCDDSIFKWPQASFSALYSFVFGNKCKLFLHAFCRAFLSSYTAFSLRMVLQILKTEANVLT